MNKIQEPDVLQVEFSRYYPDLILASGSPNRRELLEKGGSKVTVFVPDADESRDDSKPYEMVRIIAERKMTAYRSSSAFNPGTPAITADTLVLFNGRLLGKPESRQEAMEFYRLLSGRRHEVITGVGLYLPEKKGATFFTDISTVQFRNLDEREMLEYLDTGEYKGAAGGYRFQKTGYRLIEHIEGDWTNVVGLPLGRLISYRSSI